MNNRDIFRQQCRVVVVMCWVELFRKVFYIFCPHFLSQSWKTKIRTTTEYLYPHITTTECKLHPFDAESENKHPKARIMLACGHAHRQLGKPQSSCSLLFHPSGCMLVLCSVVSLQSQQGAVDDKIHITQ